MLFVFAEVKFWSDEIRTVQTLFLSHFQATSPLAVEMYGSR